MLDTISKLLRQRVQNFTPEDNIILNNTAYPLATAHFFSIPAANGKSISFIDGGQAEIISAANFCLSFIRVAALIFTQHGKQKNIKEFYFLTTARYDQDIVYESKIFGSNLVDEKLLRISSNHSSIKTGGERAPISSVANMARRFAELQLASSASSDFTLLDGTLQPTYANEENLLENLPARTAALAKSSSLFTTSGNSATMLLNKLGPQGCWSYQVTDTTTFVKLHALSKHVFRFEGNLHILPHLVENSGDPLFLGYPYGLIAVDRLARISNAEKQSLRMKFLLKEENKEILHYLSTTNAHDILDNI